MHWLIEQSGLGGLNVATAVQFWHEYPVLNEVELKTYFLKP